MSSGWRRCATPDHGSGSNPEPNPDPNPDPNPNPNPYPNPDPNPNPNPDQVRVLSLNAALRVLTLQGNPVAKQPTYRASIVCELPALLTLDAQVRPRLVQAPSPEPRAPSPKP